MIYISLFYDLYIYITIYDYISLFLWLCYISLFKYHYFCGFVIYHYLYGAEANTAKFITHSCTQSNKLKELPS